MRYIILKTEELIALEELYKTSSDNSIRRHSHCLLLSHQERAIIDLASIFDVNRRTIERWLDSWSKIGMDSLPILPGRGVKTRLVGYEGVVANQLEVHNRNLKNVLEYLDKEHNIKICLKTLQNFLKGTGL
jgi:transposase